jgi:hypothetical protein
MSIIQEFDSSLQNMTVRLAAFPGAAARDLVRIGQ